MTRPSFITSVQLPVRHGFFMREGGVSAAPYETLNAGLGTQDSPAAVQENRRRIAATLGLELERLAALSQVHGIEVKMLRHVRDIHSPAQSVIPLPEGDAMVSDCPDLALGIATADCAPVLFASGDGGVVGAAHAGWRGAVAGVLEATVVRMRDLGADDIRAVIGPCIGPASYEVGEDMRAVALAVQPLAESCFMATGRTGQYRFDLPGFCQARLATEGVEALWVGRDTLAESCFFSHRRATLAGDGRTGRQVAAIRAG